MVSNTVVAVEAVKECRKGRQQPLEMKHLAASLDSPSCLRTAQLLIFAFDYLGLPLAPLQRFLQNTWGIEATYVGKTEVHLPFLLVLLTPICCSSTSMHWCLSVARAYCRVATPVCVHKPKVQQAFSNHNPKYHIFNAHIDASLDDRLKNRHSQ